MQAEHCCVHGTGTGVGCKPWGEVDVTWDMHTLHPGAKIRVGQIKKRKPGINWNVRTMYNPTHIEAGPGVEKQRSSILVLRCVVQPRKGNWSDMRYLKAK